MEGFQRFSEAPSEQMKVDQRDKKILSMLSVDSRMPLSKLAKATYISKVAVHNRINTLQEKGIIKGFTTSIDLRYLGYSTYHIFMVINESDQLKKQHLIEHLMQIPNTKNIIEYSDRWDLEWVIIAKDLQEFDTIVTEATNKFSEIIMEKHKFGIIYGYESMHYPINLEHASENLVLNEYQTPEIIKLDESDYKIINALVKNSRESVLQIAQNIGLTQDIVRYRLKKLQESGLIRHNTAIINLSALNLHWHTLCINLKKFDSKSELKFKEYISTKPQIIRAVKVLGDWDLMLHVVAETLQEVHFITKELEQNFTSIFSSYQSLLGFKEHYYTSFPRLLEVNDEARQ